MTPARITVWPNLHDVHGESIETTWHEWFAKLSVAQPYLGDRKHPGWSAAVLEPPERADDNVAGLSALVLDYDAGTTIDQAVECWRDHLAFLHTTRKHSPANPRFRLILPLSRIVTVDEYAVMWRWACDLVTAAGHKVDGSTKNASRFWFLPGTQPGGHFETRSIPGEPLDPDPIVQSECDRHVEDYAKRYAENASRSNDAPTGDAFKRARAYLAKLPEAISRSGGHRQTWAAATAVVVGFKLSDDDAYTLLCEYNARCKPPWSERELRHKIQSARTQCKREPGWLLNVPRNNVRPIRSAPRASYAPPRGGTGTDGPAPAPAVGVFARGDEAELAAAALSTMSSDEAPMRFDEGEFWRHAPERGVWDLVGAHAVRNTVAAFAGRFIDDGKDMKVLKVSQSMCVGTANRLRDFLIASSPVSFRDAPAGIAFRNGFVRMVNGAPTLLPHSPDNLARSNLPFDYEPDAPTPALTEFLHDVFADTSEDDRAARISLLQEFVGASLFGLATKYQRCLMLYGDGGNGKSQVMTVVKSVFPGGTVTSLSPKDWDGPTARFRLERLRGALLNAVEEMPARDVLASEMFKAIVTGDPVTAELKGKDAFDFSPRCGHIFSGNTLPTTADHTLGFFRRFHVLPFTRSFVGSSDERIDVGASVVAAERPAIAAWAVQGARRLVSQGKYTEPPSVAAIKDRWVKESDSVRMWLSEQCEARGENLAKWLYDRYSEWAKSSGFMPVALSVFGRRLVAAGYARREDRTGRSVYGVSVRIMT